MKNSGFKKLTYEQALLKEQQRQKRRRLKVASRPPSKKYQQFNQNQGKLENEWKLKCRTRDQCKCQYPGCTYRDLHIPVHHLNPRSQRKDLKFVETNGKCLCTKHHSWAHANQQLAVQMGLFAIRSRELAIKEGTIGVY